MSDMGFGRMPAIMFPCDREKLDNLRADYRRDNEAYRDGRCFAEDFAETAHAYIEELERWVGGDQR